MIIRVKKSVRQIVNFIFRLDRDFIAKMYLRGNGIEIGALDYPLKVPKSARVEYVDRLPLSELKNVYPPERSRNFVPVDVVDDGEQLKNIPDTSQDFVIASHFFEHCPNPVLAFQNMFRVLREDGIMYLTVPDKRYTFDKERPLTTLEHLINDYNEGPEGSEEQHLKEFVDFVRKPQNEVEREREIAKVRENKAGVHYHVWTQSELFELFMALKKKFNLNFDVELFYFNKIEVIFVLRKKE